MFTPSISRFSFVGALDANQVSCSTCCQHYTVVKCAHFYTSARPSISRKRNSLSPPQVAILFRPHPSDLDLHYDVLKGAPPGLYSSSIPGTRTASSRSSAQAYAHLQCHLSLKIMCISGDLVISTYETRPREIEHHAWVVCCFFSLCTTASNFCNAGSSSAHLKRVLSGIFPF